MAKTKIYISGAITGVADYMKHFQSAEDEINEVYENSGVMVLNPAKINANMPEGTSYEEYMKMAFCLLEMCDTIYMLKGWEKSRGANREYGYALGKDMTIIFE